MSHSMRSLSSEIPAPDRAPRTAAQMGRRARSLKLELSNRLAGVRAARRLVARDVHDRPQLVSEWESPHKPHAPNALHLAEQVSDPLSRPYALEVIAWVLELAEREEPSAAQLSIFDLINRS
jgi:hypothetical protein